MPQSIPPGLKREHVLQALHDLDGGTDHPFGPATGYELFHADNRYALKAVVGLAFLHHLGCVLRPEEFSGGEAPRLVVADYFAMLEAELLGKPFRITETSTPQQVGRVFSTTAGVTKFSGGDE